MRIIDMPEFKDRGSLLTFPKDKSVFDAAKVMGERNVGAVIIMEGDKLAGIFSERDLMRRVVAADKDPKKLILADVMTANVKTALSEDTVTDSMRRMSQGRFRHLPVVDADGKLLGIVSQGDFVAITWFELWQRLSSATKTSFFSYTQLWMIVLCVMIYVSVVLWVM